MRYTTQSMYFLDSRKRIEEVPTENKKWTQEENIMLFVSES